MDPPVKKTRKRKDKSKPDILETAEESPRHVIVQIPLSSEKIKQIINENQAIQVETAPPKQEHDKMLTKLHEERTGNIPMERENVEPRAPVNILGPEPIAYEPANNYESEPAVQQTEAKPFQVAEANVTCCYWCCHPIDYAQVSLPIRYDSITETFTSMGNFCSYECAAAYNFSMHQGTDRMWEIHSWLELIAEKSGLELPLRPAPSRYTLTMFGGSLSIQEFRTVHRNMSRLVLCNIPPLISVFPQTEVMNTSYMCPQIDKDRLRQAHERIRIKKSLAFEGSNATKNTLEKKMKVSFLEEPAPPLTVHAE